MLGLRLGPPSGDIHSSIFCAQEAPGTCLKRRLLETLLSSAHSESWEALSCLHQSDSEPGVRRLPLESLSTLAKSWPCNLIPLQPEICVSPAELRMNHAPGWDRAAPLSRQGAAEASAVSSGFSARGRRARAEPERCRLTKRPDARRRQVRRGTSRAAAFPATEAQKPQQLGRLDSGEPPRYVSTEPWTLTWRIWHSWDLPEAIPGARRVRAWGHLCAPLLRRSRGPGVGSPLP